MKKWRKKMELNPGYALITTDEYKDLIETSFHQEEIIHENEKLKKEIREMQEFMLAENINDYYFPYYKDFLEKINMQIKDVIEFIRLKKTDLLEKEEQDE